MDTQSNDESLVAPPHNTQLHEVSLTQEVDSLSLSLSPTSSPWTANELYLSDVRLPPLPSLPHGGQLNTATTQNHPNEAHHQVPVAMSSSLQQQPMATQPMLQRGRSLLPHVSHPQFNMESAQLHEESLKQEVDPLSLSLSPTSSPWTANELYLSDVRLPPLPSLPHGGQLNTATTQNHPDEAHHQVPVPMSGSLQQQPMATQPMLQRGRSLLPHVSHPQFNMESARGSTGAPGVLMSRTTTNQRNAAFANMMLEGAQRALNLQHAQYAHALQYCHTVQQWYAEVAHDEQEPQNAYSEQNAPNLGAAPTEPAVATTGEPENTANANDAHLLRFPAPLASDLDQLMDEMLAEPDADGVVSGTEFLHNWT